MKQQNGKNNKIDQDDEMLIIAQDDFANDDDGEASLYFSKYQFDEYDRRKRLDSMDESSSSSSQMRRTTPVRVNCICLMQTITLSFCWFCLNGPFYQIIINNQKKMCIWKMITF